MEEPEKPIWITGAAGLIGNYLVQTAPAQTAVLGITRKELDLTDFAAVKNLFGQSKPKAVIHCAALSRSVDCQANPALARKINVELTSLLADLAAEVPLIFFSSDLIFDGQTGNYDEAAKPNPLSIYGETKVAAEQIVLANPKHTVVRTSLNGGTSTAGNRGFNEEMRVAWQQGRTVNLFIDEFRTPIPAIATARAIWELLERNRPGLYHLAGAEKLSRCEIGKLLAARWPQLNPKIKSGSLKEYQGAPRAPNTSLNCAKIQELLGFPLPGLTQWLAENPEMEF